jgi:hypothetical protein
MKVAFGLKAHSGWAALIVIGKTGGEYIVIDRRRVELVEEAWARQPYHAADELEPQEARALVKQGVDAAHRIALREIRVLLKRERARGNNVTGCAVLVGNPMPDWSTAEILAVHFRMHQAEGVLFRDALAVATRKSGLRLVAIPEKELPKTAQDTLGASLSELTTTIAQLGKSVGPPWTKDQKDAALAAMIALKRSSK